MKTVKTMEPVETVELYDITLNWSREYKMFLVCYVPVVDNHKKKKK